MRVLFMSYLRQELDMKIASITPRRRGTIVEIAILVKMMTVDGGVLGRKLSLQAGLFIKVRTRPCPQPNADLDHDIPHLFYVFLIPQTSISLLQCLDHPLT